MNNFTSYCILVLKVISFHVYFYSARISNNSSHSSSYRRIYITGWMRRQVLRRKERMKLPEFLLAFDWRVIIGRSGVFFPLSDISSTWRPCGHKTVMHRVIVQVPLGWKCVIVLRCLVGRGEGRREGGRGPLCEEDERIVKYTHVNAGIFVQCP